MVFKDLSSSKTRFCPLHSSVLKYFSATFLLYKSKYSNASQAMEQSTSHRRLSWQPNKEKQLDRAAIIRNYVPMKSIPNNSPLAAMSQRLSDFIMKQSVWKLERSLSTVEQRLVATLARTDKNSDDYKTLSRTVDDLRTDQAAIRTLVEKLAGTSAPDMSLAEFQDEFNKYRSMFQSQTSQHIAEVRTLQEQIQRLRSKIVGLESNEPPKLPVSRYEHIAPPSSQRHMLLGKGDRLSPEPTGNMITPENSQVIPG